MTGVKGCEDAREARSAGVSVPLLLSPRVRQVAVQGDKYRVAAHLQATYTNQKKCQSEASESREPRGHHRQRHTRPRPRPNAAAGCML